MTDTTAPPRRGITGRLLRHDWWFGALVVVVVVIRFGILRAGGAPPTIDGGNWLAYADQLLGDGVRSSSIVYPPMVPVITKAATAAFGLTTGISFMAAVAAAAPGVGLYVALRLMGQDLAALIPAVLVLGAGSVGEAAAWGGFPQLIGFGLMPVVLVLVERLLDRPGSRRALAAGIGFTAILATSHFVATLAALAIVVVVTLAVGAGQRLSPRTAVSVLALFVVPSLWLIPTYAGLTRTFWQTSGPIAFNPLTWDTLLDRIEFLYRDSPWLWRVLIPIAAAAPIVVRKLWRTPMWRTPTAMWAAILLGTAALREARVLYLLTVAAGLGLALLVAGVGRQALRLPTVGSGRTGLALGGVTILLVTQLTLGLRFFDDQVGFYRVLTPELTADLERIPQTQPPGAVLAVTSLRDAPLGWWVEAITKRETYYGAPLHWLLFPDELRRASAANDLFVPPFPTSDRIEMGRRMGVDLILVPTDWIFYSDDLFDEFAADHPGAVVELSKATIAIDPAAAG